MLVFLTNNFTVPALTIAQLYRGRWQIELFFKWIKQHAMLQILSLTLFEKTPLLQVFSDPDMFKNTIDPHNQPSLPGFLTGQL